MAKGRPPEGPNLAERLDGPEDDRRKLKIILETIAGQRPIASACAELGIGEARFHELRKQALQAALEGIAARPAGRPPEPVSEPDPRIAELETKLRDMDLEVRAAHVRERIALTMPHLLESLPESPSSGEDVKKKRKPSKVLDRIRAQKKHRR